MLRKLILLPLILLISNTYAQQNFHSTYTWESKPEYALKDKTKDIVSVKEKVVAEFLFEGEKFVEYFIEHKVFWLNSDDAIEQFNKIYLPLDGQSSLTANKA